MIKSLRGLFVFGELTKILSDSLFAFRQNDFYFDKDTLLQIFLP